MPRGERRGKNATIWFILPGITSRFPRIIAR